MSDEQGQGQPTQEEGQAADEEGTEEQPLNTAVLVLRSRQQMRRDRSSQHSSTSPKEQAAKLMIMSGDRCCNTALHKEGKRQQMRRGRSRQQRSKTRSRSCPKEQATEERATRAEKVVKAEPMALLKLLLVLLGVVIAATIGMWAAAGETEAAATAVGAAPRAVAR